MNILVLDNHGERTRHEPDDDRANNNNLINQAAELKVPSIKFNWRGEPLLHPKLFDYIKYAKEKGILENKQK